MKDRGAVMHPYLWEHIVSLYYRTAGWMIIKHGRDKESIALHVCKAFPPDPLRGGAKIGRGRAPFFKKLLQIGRPQQQIENITMLKKHVVKQFWNFWFHSEAYFLTRFGVVLDLVISTHFLSNSFISNDVKGFIYINFVYFS